MGLLAAKNKKTKNLANSLFGFVHAVVCGLEALARNHEFLGAHSVSGLALGFVHPLHTF